jgi:hypothetical protein
MSNSPVLVYEKPGCVQISYLPDKNIILLDWDTFGITRDELGELHEKALQTARANNCHYYLADTSRVRDAFDVDIVKWWGTVWVPKLVKGGIRGIVTVAPASAIATMSTRSWQSQLVAGIFTKNVQSRASALATIAELRNGAGKRAG